MRVALFSDVHGNAVAFDAFLADLDEQRVDHVVCLGDHAQGGPQPAECLERLRDLECPAVMGNSDDFLLTLTLATSRRQRLSSRLPAGRRRSSEELLDFHRSFQPTVELDLGGGSSLLAFHGTPRSRDEVVGPWMEEAAFREPFEGVEATVLAGGHTHQQWARRLGDRYYVNPGSVGVAYDHHQPEESFHADPCAEYAVLTVDGQGVGVEFRRVPFDAGAVIQAIEASGMPHADRATRFWR